MIIKVRVLLVYDKERTISLFFKYLGDSHILIDKPIVRYTICNIMLQLKLSQGKGNTDIFLNVKYIMCNISIQLEMRYRVCYLREIVKSDYLVL